MFSRHSKVSSFSIKLGVDFDISFAVHDLNMLHLSFGMLVIELHPELRRISRIGSGILDLVKIVMIYWGKPKRRQVDLYRLLVLHVMHDFRLV